MERDRIGSQMMITGILLTFTGGFLDAYTYSSRGGVFANAQTGNIVKLGLRLAEGRYTDALLFLIPIFAFTAGTYICLVMEKTLADRHFFKRSILLTEIAVFAAVSCIPDTSSGNIMSNALISLIAAMQMEGFRSFEGIAFTTTVSTGNLRKAVECFAAYRLHGKTEKINEMKTYLVIIFLFIFGAFSGMLMTEEFGRKTILVLILPVSFCFALITVYKIRRVGISAGKKRQ